MENKRKRYSLLLVGLVLILATSVIACGQSYTQEDLEEARQTGYNAGFTDGYEAGSGINIEEDYLQYFIQGNVYLTQEKWDEAIAKYTKAIELNPEYIEAYVKRAMAYNEKDDFYELAIIDCEKATELDPNVKLDSSLARAYVKRGEYNAKFVKEKGYEFPGYEGNEENQNNFDNAVVDFTAAIELNPRLAEAYKGRADSYATFYGDVDDFVIMVAYNTTIADYTMAIALNPTNAEYYMSRAMAYHLVKDYDRELVDETKAIELDPTNAAYYRSRGLIYMAMSNYTKAITDFTKAIELQLEDNYVYSYRGEAYTETGWYDLAVIDYTKAIELTPRSFLLIHLYSERGGVYLELGDYNQAIADFTKAIELDSYPSSTYYNDRALAYLERHSYDLAISDSSKAIELNPDGDDAYWTRGQAYVAIGEKDRALADFRKVLSLTDDFEDKYVYPTSERNKLVRQEIEKLQ